MGVIVSQKFTYALYTWEFVIYWYSNTLKLLRLVCNPEVQYFGYYQLHVIDLCCWSPEIEFMVLLPQQQLLYSTVFGNDFSAWQNLSSFSVYNLVWLLTGLIVFMLGGIRPLNFYCSDDLMQGSSNGFNLGAVLRTRADNWVLSARFCASGNWLQSFFLISSYAVCMHYKP